MNSRLATAKAKPASGMCAWTLVGLLAGTYPQHDEFEDRMHPGECRA